MKRLALLAALFWLSAATVRAEDDGFAWNQKAWSMLAQGRLKEADEFFLKAIDRSSTTASQAEANLGLGIAARARSRPKEGMRPLRSALVQGPYLLPIAAYETALTALALGEKKAGLAFLRQSADLDPLNLEALRELARLSESEGDKTAAWRAYDKLAGFDGRDAEAAGRLKELSRSFKKGKGPASPVRRLIHPLLQAEVKSPFPLGRSSATLRVGLFSDEEGRPSEATRLFFLTNSSFQVTAAGGARLLEAAQTEGPWRIIFRPEDKTVEIRDAEGNIKCASAGPFLLAASGRQGSILIQNPRLAAAAGVDAGDREMRGSLRILPNAAGFTLVNEVVVEDYVYGALGAALPAASPQEAYKAEAVVLRTLALWHKSRALPGQASDICDSSFCQKYVGVNDEMREATQAVAATEGEVLTRDGRPAEARWHENCGGLTEDGVSDSPGETPALQSQEGLGRWTHGFPPAKAYCALPAVQSRWVRILSAADLKLRAGHLKPIGDIIGLRPLRRSAGGRVEALEAAGSRGSLTLEGAKAIADFLSPGSLRSTLFTIQPLKKGFMLWGAGTGSGRGLCAAGAVGQADLGWTYDKILAHYFPGLALGKLPEGR